MKKLSNYFENKIRSLLEAPMDTEGNPIKPTEDLETLQQKAKTKEKLVKIAKEEAANVGEDIKNFSIETMIGDLTSLKEANNEDPEKINSIVKTEIKNAIQDLKNSENESCVVQISYTFKNDTTELRIYFSFDKKGDITPDVINVPPFKKIKTIKEFQNKWEAFSWRTLE